jgi:hypothetical protein
MLPAFRRITTERAQDGTSVLAEDIAVEINEPGVADFWSTSAMPARCDELHAFGTAPARLEPRPAG